MAANSLRPGPVVQGDRRWFGGSRWFGSKVSSEKVSTNINNSRSMLSVFQLCKRFKRGHKLRAPPPGAALARQRHHVRAAPDILTSAANRLIGSTTGCSITEKAPTRAFSLLKAATTAFTFKTLLRHYAEWALTPW